MQRLFVLRLSTLLWEDHLLPERSCLEADCNAFGCKPTVQTRLGHFEVVVIVVRQAVQFVTAVVLQRPQMQMSFRHLNCCSEAKATC